MNPPILVTGATDTIGSHLIQHLTVRQVPVRVFVPDLASAESFHAPSVEIATGDLRDPSTIRNALHGIEKVFLFSRPAPDQVALQGNVVRVAQEMGVCHIVKVSALGTRPDSPLHLARWHAETEDQIREADLSFTFLHPHLLMQRFFDFVSTIARDDAFQAPLGDAAVSMVDARDVAEVAAAVLQSADLHAGQTYVITGPEPVSYADAAEALSTALGRPIRYVDVPFDAYRRMLIEADLPEWLADDLTALHRILRAGHGAQVSPVVRDLTGQRGRSFGEFAQDYADTFRPVAAMPA